MKAVLELRKIFWPINSTLLIVLVYLAVNLISGKDAVDNSIARQIPIEEKAEIVPFESPLPSGNDKIIIERDIFGLSELREANENPQAEITDSPAFFLKEQLRLLATIAGDEQLACAVIGNLKTRVQGIYKAGDIIEGAKIERIDRNKIVLFHGEQGELLELYITCDVSGDAYKKEEPVFAQQQEAAARDINKETFITQVPGIEAFLEKIEVTPYVINGEEKGLCITGLNDLNIAGHFGLENNDVIQSLNGQMLHDKRKAFQVLKKARSQSSLNFQLLRNQRKMDISIEI